jgi:hypothetical protein
VQYLVQEVEQEPMCSHLEMLRQLLMPMAMPEPIEFHIIHLNYLEVAFLEEYKRE